MIEYRIYQIEIINKIIQSIQSGLTRPLVVLPTAGGKTIIAAGLLNKLSSIYGPINSHIVVPFSNLKKQTQANLTNMGVSSRVHTYSGAIKLQPQTADILICDEAHHAVSPSWQQVFDNISTPIVCGLTGTPYRVDDCPLLEENGGVFTNLIDGPSIEELTKAGYLANLEYYSYPMRKIVTKEPFYLLNEYIGSIEKYTYTPETHEEDIVEEYQKSFANIPAVVFSRTKEHADKIADKFNVVGIKANSINCYLPTHTKDQIINDFKSNKIQILTTVNMISEGFDMPQLKLAIMARPIKNSLTMFLQQIGRVLRIHNNETAKILDLVGNIFSFGLPSKLLNQEII
jgi:superfamily II DNA or RNA helicase